MPKSIRMVREKDCKHSVRFKAENTDPNDPPAIDTVYISRSHPGVNHGFRLELTVEIAE